jgi:membrane protease YdiL (CAAX protease family)
MNTAIDLRSDRRAGLLPVVAGVSLLLSRLLMMGRGGTSIAILTLLYLAVLMIARPGRVALPVGRAAFPLVVGAGAILSARLLLPAPFPMRSTFAGVVLSVLAAVAEEGLFRGALFARLLPGGRSVAIVTSAAAFALLHVPFYGLGALPVDLGAGLLFAWQRSESGSWSVPAATHALANIMAVLP